MRTRLITFIMTLMLLLSCGVPSVSRNGLTAEELRNFAVMSLEPGDVIRYALAGSNQRIEGVVQQIDPDGLHIHSDDRLSFVATDTIEWLWVRRRSLKTGALIGAVPGFLVVTVFGAIGLGSFEDGSMLLAPLLGCVGALITGTAGGTIGAVIPHWELLF